MGLVVTNAANAVKGKQGPAGEKEATGETREAGETGPQGPIGLTGDTGPVSTVAGPQGTIGLTGPEGPASTVAGPQGTIGLTGPPGIPTSGTDVGDMQYWDGFTWVMIPAPVKEPAFLKYQNGTPAWVNLYAIGDIGPAKGIVFYITESGSHGLEAAPVDQSTGVTGGCSGNFIYGATGTKIGTGAANTIATLAACSDSNVAARITDNYILNGYTDWYLPSIDELLLLIKAHLVNNWSLNSHWTSTNAPLDYTNNVFNVCSTNTETCGYGNISELHSVRAIRSF